MSPEKRGTGERRYPEIGSVEVRKQIGKEIKAAREFLQLTLDDVRSLIKINTYYLQSIEDGNWSFLPPTYVKAFVKSYAEAVKLPADKIDPRVDEMFKDVLSSSAQLRIHNEPRDVPPQGMTNELLLWAERNRSILFYGTLVLVIFVLIIIFLLPKEEKSQPEISNFIKPNDTESIQHLGSDSVQQVGSKITNPIPMTSPVVTELQLTQLKIYSMDTCYVKLAYEDSVLYERTLWPRNSVTREVELPIQASFGNVFGVKVILDGDTLPEFNGTRRVRRVTIGKDGYQ